jgi:predicted RNA-binding Zn ribbon-like protein
MLSSAGWPATGRFSASLAPDGLGLVQDLVNTESAGRPREPDLLAELHSAQDWVDRAMAQWARAVGREPKEIVLQPGDQDVLRDLRSDISRSVAHLGTPGGRSSSLAARLDSDGHVVVDPRGEGARQVAAAVLLECFLAQRSETWRRLKVCKSERCPLAFYDRSRNNSGAWHDTKLCGNAANLRASRARRRVAATEEA